MGVTRAAAMTHLMEQLGGAPFGLSEDDARWVESTRSAMSLDEQLRQLFAVALLGDDLTQAERVAAFRPGAVVRAPGPDRAAARAATVAAVAGARVPVLVAADLEGGVNHPANLTPAPNSLALAAANDPGLTEAIAVAIAQEARAEGYNWSLGPALDISAAFRSAIVGTRSFGSDVDRIAQHACAHIRATQAVGVASTAKHWPGEGHDDRDQHLVTTVNPLSMPDWLMSHGNLYRQAIDAGVLSVMAAHIALPAWSTERGVDEHREKFRPASASRLLNEDLLRDQLGFKGVIVSDACAMAGLQQFVTPDQLPVEVINGGCDMILFSPDPDADLQRLHAAVRQGVLSEHRIEMAVTRILAMKAAIGLHRPDRESSDEIGSPQWSTAEVARQAVTLVKDARRMLPLSPALHRRILLLEQPPKAVLPWSQPPSLEPMVEALRERGFEVLRLAPGESLETARADALLYVLTQESVLAVSRIGIDWDVLHGGFPHSMARPWHQRPVVMVSFGHPYHLYDAPTVPCYVNAYVCLPETQQAVVRKLLGEEPFSGRSPVDAFCGLAQADPAS